MKRTQQLEFRCDARTLREVVEDPAMVRVRIEQLRVDLAGSSEEIDELGARGALVGLLRVSGDLDAALVEARHAVDRARITGTSTQLQLASLRLAHVHQWRGEFGQSDAIYFRLLDHAAEFRPAVEAFTHQHAGKNFYDQGRYEAAAQHFAIALSIREKMDLPEDQVLSSRQALRAARSAAGGNTP